MTNPSRDKGTHAETAVVRYARLNGFPLAERRALAGTLDKGDILLAPGIIIEVKAHRTFSDNDIRAWLDETLREKTNANASHATLVVKRPGKGDAQVGSWWAIHCHRQLPAAPVWMLLKDVLTLYRIYGFGDEL